MTRQDFIKIAKKIVSEIDQPSLDIYAVEQMWDDIEKVSKKLRNVNKNIQIYKKSFESSKYKTYEDFKKVMKKNLSEVKEYCEYVADKINKISNNM